MSADPAGSKAFLHSPLRPDTTSPVSLKEATYASPESSSAGLRTCSCGAELISKACNGLRLSEPSRRSCCRQSSWTAESTRQQHASSFLDASAPRQLPWEGGNRRYRRQQSKEETEEGKHQESWPDPSGRTCVVSTGRRTFLFDYRRRWCMCAFFSFAFLLITLHRFLHDNNSHLGNSVFSVVTHFPPYTYLVGLHPSYSPVPASLSSLFSFHRSTTSDVATTSTAPSLSFPSASAAVPSHPPAANAEGSSLSGSAPARQAASAGGAHRGMSPAAGGESPVEGTAEEEAAEGETATDEGVIPDESVHVSSDSVNAGGIDLYTYDRVGGLTLVHDAAAGGPAAALVGHRTGGRRPPFTQALIASPFQRPLAVSAAATVASTANVASAELAGRAGGGGEEQRANEGREHAKSFSTPAEECLFRFGGASVLLETSGLYNQSFIREFDFCTGETLRQLYLHPSLFAEGAAFLWEPQQQMLLLLVLTWKERLMLVLHAETWSMIGTLKTHFEGWGLASNLSTADAAAALAFVKEAREAAAAAAANGATTAGAATVGTVNEELHARQEGEPGGRTDSSAATGALPPAAISEDIAAKLRSERNMGAATDDAAAAGSVLLPMALQLRLKQQRLWATTGRDVLLELDVLNLLESVRKLPGFAAASAVAASETSGHRRGMSRKRSSRDVYDTSGVVNEEEITEAHAARQAEAAEPAAAIVPENIQTEAHRNVETSAVTAKAPGDQTEAATAGAASRRDSPRNKIRERSNEDDIISTTPFDAPGEETAEEEGRGGSLRVAQSAPRGARAVQVSRVVRLQCMGVALPMLNELEYIPERKTLLANIYGAYILAEVNVDSGACRSLGSFGGLDGVLRSSDEYDRVMNGIALPPPRSLLVGSSSFPLLPPRPRPPAASSSSAAVQETSATAVATPGTAGAAAAAVNTDFTGKEGGADLLVLEDKSSIFDAFLFLANTARAVLSPFALLHRTLQNSIFAAVPVAPPSAVTSSTGNTLPPATLENISAAATSADPAAAANPAAAAAADIAAAAAAGTPVSPGSVGEAFPLTLLLTGKQWQELHVVNIVPLLSRHKLVKRGGGGGGGGSTPVINSYAAIEAAYPGFFSRRGLQSELHQPS